MPRWDRPCTGASGATGAAAEDAGAAGGRGHRALEMFTLRRGHPPAPSAALLMLHGSSSEWQAVRVHQQKCK